METSRFNFLRSSAVSTSVQEPEVLAENLKQVDRSTANQSISKLSRTSASAFDVRGVIIHSKGTGYLQAIRGKVEFKKSDAKFLTIGVHL